MGNLRGICIFVYDAEDLVGAIPAIVEFVEVGEGVILFECGSMHEDEVVNFERGGSVL